MTPTKNPHAVALGQRGGVTMSPARQAHLERIAGLGAAARWRTKKELREVRHDSALNAALDQARRALDLALKLRVPGTMTRLAQARKLLGEEVA